MIATKTFYLQPGETVTTQGVHQKPSLHLIDLSGYTNSIFNSIIHLKNLNPSLITLRVNIQKTWLTGDQILHCSMVIYFLFAYILKYAFPKNCSLNVYVGLYTKQKSIALVVRDNGISLPSNLKIPDPKTRNLEFVYRLVKELNGMITVGNGPGNRFEILFPLADDVSTLPE